MIQITNGWYIHLVQPYGSMVTELLPNLIYKHPTRWAGGDDAEDDAIRDTDEKCYRKILSISEDEPHIWRTVIINGLMAIRIAGIMLSENRRDGKRQSLEMSTLFIIFQNKFLLLNALSGFGTSSGSFHSFPPEEKHPFRRVRGMMMMVQRGTQRTLMLFLLPHDKWRIRGRESFAFLIRKWLTSLKDHNRCCWMIRSPDQQS